MDTLSDGLTVNQFFYKMEMNTFEKMLIKKEVVIKAETYSVVDLETTVIRLETEKGLLIKTNNDHFACSSQTATSGRPILDK